MFCPECGGEYRDGFTTCADCGAALVAERPKEPEVLPEGDLVCVFTSSDAALIPVVESLLDGAALRYMVKGEQVQDFFGWGRLGGANLIVGPVEFYVRPDEVEAARAVLSELADPPAADVDGPVSSE